MTSLSPAAQAVWDAFNEDEAGVFVDYGDKLAAALRAAADQVVPEGVTWESPFWQARQWPSAEERAGRQDEAWHVRHQLLVIANELEGKDAE